MQPSRPSLPSAFAVLGGCLVCATYVVFLLGANVATIAQDYAPGAKATPRAQPAGAKATPRTQPDGCALPVGAGTWNCSGSVRNWASPGERCAFTPFSGYVCGAASYSVDCDAVSQRLTRRPICFANFDVEDALVAKGADLEATPAMQEWRRRVLQPEAPDAAFLAAACSGNAEGRAAPHLGHVVTGAGETWTFGHTLNVLAALSAWRLDRVYVHHVGAVSGGNFWWNEMAKNPRLTLRRHDPVKIIFGFPVANPQHQADVIRLEALLEFGGVYFDTDVLALNDLNDVLARGRTAVAVERPAGLINAMVVAPRNATFVQAWYRSYHARGPGCWNCASVVWPPRLAFSRPCEIEVLPTRSLLVRGQYSEKGLWTVQYAKDYDFGNMRAAHFFSNRGGCFFKSVRPNDVARGANTTYFQMLRHALGQDALLQLATKYADCPAVAEQPCGAGHARPSNATRSRQNDATAVLAAVCPQLARYKLDPRKPPAR
ncbi:hypothetical protein M885DRAFT_610315 [Pelagophyceae sp. CCMP2097]|nr:hypothetical protein M885DRAFT_610315 [Pelagophyceae sp. CCMP2097]